MQALYISQMVIAVEKADNIGVLRKVKYSYYQYIIGIKKLRELETGGVSLSLTVFQSFKHYEVFFKEIPRIVLE